MGVVPLAASEYSLATIESTYVKTGSYSLRIEDAGYARFAVSGTPTSLYVSVWCRLASNNDAKRVRVYVETGHYVEVRHNPTTEAWDIYVNNSLEASGSIVRAFETWHHLQVYFNIANSGEVTVKVDGVEDASFSGDTMPGATGGIEYVYLYADAGGVSHHYNYFDDFSFGTGDWGGDLRGGIIVPDGDDSVEWTPSTGTDNHDVVNEIPASDSDYITSGSSSEKDVYTLGDWDGAGKTPQFCTAWVRAKKTTASSRQLQHGVDSSGTEELATLYDLSTSFVFYPYVVEDDPDGGGAFSDAVIDALKAVVNSG